MTEEILPTGFTCGIITSPGTVHHNCTYCGGWDEEVENKFVDTVNALHLNHKDNIRVVCVKCWMKMCDMVLGPQPCPTCGGKIGVHHICE